MKSVTFKRYNLTFEEGTTSWNHLGPYNIISITDDKSTMTVEYTNGPKKGQRQDLNIKGQAKVIHNEKIRNLRAMHMQELDLTGDKESFTLGYLATHGWISVRVKEHDRAWFEPAYKKLTGLQPPTANVRGENYVVLSDDEDKRGQTYYIIFDTLPDEYKGLLSFGSNKIKWSEWEGGAKVHSKDLALNLLQTGFLLGKNSDNVSRIRNRVVNKEEFDKGASFKVVG